MAEKKQNPKYNMWQSAAFMVRLAIREREKKVPVLCILTALLAVTCNLSGLYVAPVILGSVEALLRHNEYLFSCDFNYTSLATPVTTLL